ncbi:MAG: class I SAM-dependent methyltransferase [Acidobacteriota bacterium]
MSEACLDGSRRRGAAPRLLALACLTLLWAAGAACTVEVKQQPEEPAEPAHRAQALDRSVLDHPSRTEDDRYRDGGFKPIEVYEFFGIRPGMTVADVWPGRGYHTHLLSFLVGDDGKVVAVLGPLYTQEKYEQRVREALNERIEAGGLRNVEIVGPLSELADDSIDVMITVRNYHDLGDEAARTAVLPELLRALKPGGILGVVEAYTPKEGVDEPYHRINEDLVIREITAAGFELAGTSDLLVNPGDTYDFDGREDDAPIHRYFIHRFVHKYRKPAA